MNKLDKNYLKIVTKILRKGNKKNDRTGTGTYSIFGEILRHHMSEGFPLLTTKKMFTSGIIEELLWFMRGETNIRPLVLKGVNIWNGDAYKKYETYALSLKEPGLDTHIPDPENGFPMIMSEKEFVEKIKNDEKFAKKWGELGRIYGAQWRSWRGTKYALQAFGADKPVKGIDQFRNLIHDLNDNPDSRRLMVSSWKVDELDKMTLPPCHYHYQCYTRELSVKERINIVAKHPFFDPFDFGIGPGQISHKDIDRLYPDTPKRELSLAWNQRSVDTFLGLPFNIASYGFLLKILATIVNMVPGELIGLFGDTHIYSNHKDAAMEQKRNEPFPLCEVEFNSVNKYWDNNIFDLDGFIKNISKEDFIIKNYKSHGTIKAPLSN